MLRWVDGLVNLVANIATSRDKAAQARFTAYEPDVTELHAAYAGDWMARKIVDAPAEDATRRWREWQADKQQITAIEAEEERLGVQRAVREALVCARLEGLGVIYLGTGDADDALPLDLDAVGAGGLRYLTVLSTRHLSPGPEDMDPASEWFGGPAEWLLMIGAVAARRIHPSRLVILQGAPRAASDPRRALGRGHSVLEPLLTQVRNTASAYAIVASLLHEAKVDVVSIPGLMAQITDPDYEARLTQRATVAATLKGINGMLMLDAEEIYTSKTMSFSGLPDVLDRMLQAVAGGADMPVTRFLGVAPAGLNSTGEGDARNYYDHIAAMQTLVIGPAMRRLDETLIRSALGSRPDNVWHRWRSLWQQTDKELADTAKVRADTIKVLSDAKLWPPEALATAGANAIIESGALPGFEDAIAEAGALDFDAEREAEEARALAAEAIGAIESNADPEEPDA